MVRRDAAVALAVHFERARRSQHRGPLDVVQRRTDVGGLGSRMKYFTSRMREVLSARSIRRPSWQKCQPSPWVMVASVMPVNADWPFYARKTRRVTLIRRAAPRR